MIIGVIGIGLIGGSIARDLKKLGYHIIGHDANEKHIEQALEIGIIDKSLSIDDICRSADLIVLSIPVKKAPDVLHSVLDKIKWNTVVIDTGSTKQSICDAVCGHPKRSRFVACHPLAGTEFSGPTAAIEGLFVNKKNIICNETLSDEDAVHKVLDVFESLGMKTLFMESAAHDRHMAYVSHLSHVSSFMLGSTVLEIEKDEKQIVNLASTGFESTVRLAKSSPTTWSSIFIDNKENVLPALRSYIEHLKKFEKALESPDESELQDLILKANEIKKVLSSMKYNIVKLS